VRVERVTADPRSPVIVEQFRSVVVMEGAVRVEFTSNVVPASVETFTVEAVMSPTTAVEAESAVV
jgi:hypothetical protein